MKSVYDKLYIYTDGGARGNPGPAGIGAVILDDKNNVIGEVSRFIGVATNNVAEYLAVIYGLHESLYKGASSVFIRTDSQLVARQLKGEYKIKDANLRKFSDIALNLFRFFKSVDIEEIPREQNKAADRLVNKAIDYNGLI